jgi:hypothetical protein
MATFRGDRSSPGTEKAFDLRPKGFQSCFDTVGDPSPLVRRLTPLLPRTHLRQSFAQQGRKSGFDFGGNQTGFIEVF